MTAVAYASTPLDVGGSDASGVVIFIDRKGHTRLMKTDALQGGQVSVNPRREVSFDSPTNAYVIEPDSPLVLDRVGTANLGHWAEATDDGIFVSAFNSGQGSFPVRWGF